MTETDRSLLVLGGSSDIGRAVALAFATAGWSVQLAGRDGAALRREADDISARTRRQVTTHHLDVLDPDSFGAFIDGLPRIPDVAVSVVGLLGDQVRAQEDLAHALVIMRSNYEGPALLLGVLAQHFAKRRAGVIVGVSSVAGDRGRGSNYVYGSAKAGFTAFLSGLRNRLAPTGVHVVTVKPGFVRTRMTAGMKLPAALTVDPDAVGTAVLRSVERRQDEVYVSWKWLPIMTIISAIPERIFKRLSL